MGQTGNPKRFEDFIEVDCNECEHYWDNSCDGVSKAQKRSCTSYKASRSVVIPQEISSLRKEINGLRMALVILALIQVGQMLIIEGIL